MPRDIVVSGLAGSATINLVNGRIRKTETSVKGCLAFHEAVTLMHSCAEYGVWSNICADCSLPLSTRTRLDT